MSELNQETINLILREEMNEAFWYFELGRNSSDIADGNDGENFFMNSFFDKGKDLWDKFQDKAKALFCDPSTREPKVFVKELTEGSVKDIISGIVGLYMTSYSLTLAIAIPLTALTMKKGFNNLCV